MTEEEKKAQEAAAQQPVTETPVESPAATEAGADAASAEVETPSDATATETPSVRDAFRSEYAGQYPDEDLTDDEAYVNHVRGKLKERDGYEEAFNNMAGAVGRSEMFNDMLEAAKKDPEFDPVIWAVSTGQLDLDALRDDPEYAKKLADAQQTALKTKAKNKELDDQAAQNFQPSVDAIKKVQEEMGLSDDERNEVMANMYQVMQDLIVNKVDENTFRMMARGLKHDEDTDAAREEGYAQGMSKKVDDKLRKMPQQSERNGGRQTPRNEQMPQQEKRESNMFGV